MIYVILVLDGDKQVAKMVYDELSLYQVQEEQAYWQREGYRTELLSAIDNVWQTQ